MTNIPVTFGQVECNGNTPITKTNEEASDVDGSPSFYRIEPSLEDLPTERNEKKNEKLQGNMLLNWSMDEKILKGKTFSFSLICLI